MVIFYKSIKNATKCRQLSGRYAENLKITKKLNELVHINSQQDGLYWNY